VIALTLIAFFEAKNQAVHKDGAFYAAYASTTANVEFSAGLVPLRLPLIAAQPFKITCIDFGD